ncbi:MULTISPECIES: LysR family transcriptional regulator [unclassified Pseudomonas]|uniref:LysR family transcriptional regulator n=1 Tax=unclassified Pseudomonas TaxID=196821 RepID=UPI0015A29440|nr:MULTISPECIES: LysR family transcriptional regulator [unclassified Pseudomonas]NWC95209.1 LysR family transcriptional regulator [Pseudomonas sp. IPO3779]NWD17191.1 LysR family transcriptional regulator [Pseudomonas sp. IPO3778]
MQTLDLVLLRSFVVVAEQRSMTVAAQHLHVSQGAVSQQIRRLEEVLGGTLFVRDRRGMRLAPLGERLFTKAQQMLALNQQIWADVKGSALQGRVRLGVPYDLAGEWIAPILKAFVEANGQVDLSLTCGSSLELKTGVGNGSLDLAIIEEAAAGASGECLSIDRLVWVGAKGGTAFLNTPLAISLVAETCAFRESVITALQGQDRQWKMVFDNGNLETTRAMVGSDLAVSVWLKSAVPPGLDVVPAQAQLPELPPFAISLLRSKGTASAAAVELVRHIHEHLDQL